MKNFYAKIFSHRDIISFISGIIVSGYVVEISISPNSTQWHWSAVEIGILFGFLTFILVEISKRFEECMVANKAINNGIKRENNISESWDRINNKNLKTTKIFLLRPYQWMPIIVISLPILLFLGIFFLNKGNQIQNKQISEEKKELIQNIDSLNNRLLQKKSVEIQQLQDSLLSAKATMEVQSKEIDSLEKVIKSSK